MEQTLVAKSTPSPLLLALKILVWLQYGGGYYWFFLRPIKLYFDSEDNPTESVFLFLFLFPLTIAILATVSARGMCDALRSLHEPVIVAIWSKVALLLAPFMGVIYFYIGVQLPPIKSDFLAWLGIFAPPLVGFLMPFMLLTLWLRYRCRQDEF